MTGQREHPWTQGPWEWVDSGTRNKYVRHGVVVGPEREFVIAGTEQDDDEAWADHEDAALICLAPEMADAILALVDDWDGRLRRMGYDPAERRGPMEPTEAAITVLADKLRGIGGAS